MQGLVQVQQKPWLFVFEITGISIVTDEANTNVYHDMIKKIKKKTLNIEKGILHVEKVVIT